MAFEYNIDNILVEMTLRQKVAGLFILHVSGTDPTVHRTFLSTYSPAGLIFMDDTIPSTAYKIKEFIKNIQGPLPYLFAIDQEGGSVSRLQDDSFPSARQLKDMPLVNTVDTFAKRSELLRELGFNLNFGIVADASDTPSDFIYSRTFGGNVAKVSEHVSAAVRATGERPLVALKHFPGHGITAEDSHTQLPVSKLPKHEWERTAARPFISGIREGVPVLMFGHLIAQEIDTAPASLSLRWHDIARRELGFQGLCVTDDLVMLSVSHDPRYVDPVANAIAALNAGNDLLLFVTDYGWDESRLNIEELLSGVVAAVQRGEVAEDRIDISLRRVLAIRLSL